MNQAIKRISVVLLVSFSLAGFSVLPGCDGSEVKETVRELSGAELINKGEKLKKQIKDLNAQDIERIQEDISRGVYEQE